MKCGGASLRKSDLLDSPPVLPHRKPESRRKSTPLLEQPPILRQTKAATFRRRAQSINTKSPFTSATLPAGDSKASRMKMKQHLALVNKGGEAIEIEDMIAMAGDLDVIMVATNDRTMSSLIRLATWSEYDHVLFIRRSRHTGRLSVVEAVESGVVSYGITEFIRDWSEGRYFRVAYRKLLGGLHDSSRKALEDFCSSHIGSPFGISGFFFANDFTVTPPSSPDALSSKPAQSSFSRDRTRKPLGSEESNSRRKKLTRRRRKDHSTGRRPWDSRRAFFCSELVAAAYRSAGVLKRECSEGSFTPGKFASKSCPWLAESFQLGPVMQIVLKVNKIFLFNGKLFISLVVFHALIVLYFSNRK
uniref:Uncharacterized protein n=1 Tax=Lotharella globosa TaxID=91324 RepID=A0A7S3YJI2_9EUKA